MRKLRQKLDRLPDKPLGVTGNSDFALLRLKSRFTLFLAERLPENCNQTSVYLKLPGKNILEQLPIFNVSLSVFDTVLQNQDTAELLGNAKRHPY